MKDLADSLEQVQTQLAALSKRVDQLESAALKPVGGDIAPVAAQEPPPPEPAKPPITEEEIIAISAALGAYLGVRVRIKQIRLLGSQAWAQQGRVSIQASHNLHN
jgi:methylmalonyl-CoA carboxyltransferase 12S subunit